MVQYAAIIQTNAILELNMRKVDLQEDLPQCGFDCVIRFQRL